MEIREKDKFRSNDTNETKNNNNNNNDINEHVAAFELIYAH